MQGKQGQADYKSFKLLCPSQNITEKLQIPRIKIAVDTLD